MLGALLVLWCLDVPGAIDRELVVLSCVWFWYRSGTSRSCWCYRVFWCCCYSTGFAAGLIWREMAELSAGDGAIIRSGKTQQCDNHHHDHRDDYHDHYDHDHDDESPR